jgi:FAD/FMN-containing dehydrogenase
MSTADSTLSRDLAAIVGEEHVVTEGDDLLYYAQDRCRGDWPVRASAIVFPRDVAEVQAVVRYAAAHRLAIVPSGGRTGLVGAATAIDGELVVSLQRLNAIHEVDVAARTLRCDAGATLQAVQETAAAAGLLYPVDYAARGTAQIGGAIATNAGGVKVIRYGLTRDWVRGVKVVLASGELLDLGGELVKDNTGYDLRAAFIGSEGTLGIVVEAVLGLTKPPDDHVVALVALRDMDAVLALFRRVRASTLPLSAFELFDAPSVDHVIAHRGREARGPFDPPAPMAVLLEVTVDADGDRGGALEAANEQMRERLLSLLGEATEAEEIDDAVVAANTTQARALWAWREDISEALHPHTPHKCDVSVPIVELPTFVAKWRALVASRLPGVPAVCFGHVGDGNLHLNLLRPADEPHASFHARCHAFDDELYALVHAHRGSISAEHGVGLLKRDHLHHRRTPLELQLMRGIKSVFDPQGIMNPGKIFGA